MRFEASIILQNRILRRDFGLLIALAALQAWDLGWAKTP